MHEDYGQCNYQDLQLSTMSAPKLNFQPVVGRVGTGLHDRLAIETLQKEHPEQFTLFIIAYAGIQWQSSDLDGTGELAITSQLRVPKSVFKRKIDAAESRPGDPGIPGAFPTNFMNIAGIHGKPYVEWGGDRNPQAADYSPTDPKDINPVPSRFGGTSSFSC